MSFLYTALLQSFYEFYFMSMKLNCKQIPSSDLIKSINLPRISISIVYQIHLVHFTAHNYVNTIFEEKFNYCWISFKVSLRHGKLYTGGRCTTTCAAANNFKLSCWKKKRKEKTYFSKHPITRLIDNCISSSAPYPA